MSTIILTASSIIGEDKTLSIKVGADAQDAAGEDIILVRGTSTDVDRAVKEIRQIVEDAKNDEIVNSFVSSRHFLVSAVSYLHSVDRLRHREGIRWTHRWRSGIWCQQAP